MIIFQAVAFSLVVVGAAIVVLTRDPKRQIIALGFYGALLALLFTALKAPDVAFSQLAIGTILVPFLLFVALAKMQDPNA